MKRVFDKANQTNGAHLVRILTKLHNVWNFPFFEIGQPKAVLNLDDTKGEKAMATYP
jgi:hypothetical protein